MLILWNDRLITEFKKSKIPFIDISSQEPESSTEMETLLIKYNLNYQLTTQMANMEIMKWCEEHLDGNYIFYRYIQGPVEYFNFELQEDKVIFALRWDGNEC